MKSTENAEVWIDSHSGIDVKTEIWSISHIWLQEIKECRFERHNVGSTLLKIGRVIFMSNNVENINKRVIPFSPPDISELEIAEVAEVLRSGWMGRG